MLEKHFLSQGKDSIGCFDLGEDILFKVQFVVYLDNQILFRDEFFFKLTPFRAY